MRIRYVLTMTLLLSACAGLSSGPSTTTTAAADLSPTTIGTGTATTVAQSPTTTTTPDTIVEADVGLVVVTARTIEILQTGLDPIVLQGDADVDLDVAYDDLNGGLVFQYAAGFDSPQRPIFHLAAGGDDAKVLIDPRPGRTLFLEGVSLIDGRVHVVYIERPTGRQVGGSLLAADLRGGAPVSLYEGNDLVAGEAHGTVVAVELRVGPTCGKIQVSDGDDSLFEVDCEEGTGPVGVELSPDGSLLATIVDGTIRGFAVPDGTPAGRWVPPSARTVYDVEPGRLAVPGAALSLRVLTADGAAHTYGFDAPVRSVSFLRSPAAVLRGPRLGGVVGPLGACSAAGLLPDPVPAELPDEVAATRAAIVRFATACDFDGLAALVDSRFTYGDDESGDPRRYWLANEQRFGDDLSVIVTLLSLEATTIEQADGSMLYVWPAAAGEQPTDAQWESLFAVYNEEEIATMRRSGVYTGLRVGIDSTGRWRFAVSGD